MKKFFAFHTIAGKINAGILIFGLAMGSVLAVVLWQNRQAQLLSQRVAGLHAKVSTIAVNMRGDLNYVAMTQFRQLLTRDPQDAKSRRRTWERYLRTDYDTLRQLAQLLSPAERLHLDTLGLRLAKMEAYQNQVDSLLTQGNVVDAPDSVALPAGKVHLQEVIDEVADLRFEARLKLKDVGDERQELLQAETQAIATLIGQSDRAVVVIALLAVGSFLALAVNMRRTVRQSLHQVSGQLGQLAQGGLSRPSELPTNELAPVLQAGNLLNEHLQAAAKFAQAVGEGHFGTPFVPAGPQDALGHALLTMKNRLQLAALADQQRQWASEGLQACAHLIGQHRGNPAELAKQWLAAVVGHLEANQAALLFYDEPEARLVLAASYAYGRHKIGEMSLAPGEGLAGQVFLEKESQLFAQVPASYARIRSGLGEAGPQNLVIVPVLANQEPSGVVELASLSAFEPHQVAWLEQACAQLAVGMR
jgi:putative methionine-R-sulfoxide reductase with GAF domain